MIENQKHFSNFKVEMNITKPESNKFLVNSIESHDILKINRDSN